MYVDCSHKYKINQGVMLGGRHPSVEDDLRWKTTFGRRRPMVEDNLRRKTTFGERRLLVEDDPCMLPSPLCGIFFAMILG